MNLEMYRNATREMSSKEIGAKQTMHQTFSVYAVDTVVPQVIQLGIPTLGEAEKLAESCKRHCSIVEVKTVVSVVRTVQPIG